MIPKVALPVLLFFAGCGPAVYPYRVMNDNCSCELFRATDDKARVTYSFSATYSLNDAINTNITVSILNNNADTLDLSLAHVRISSRNIPYRFNNKFLSVTIPDVPPGAQRTLRLNGEVEDVSQGDPWRVIAGEELIVTLRGMRIRETPIATQVVRFVPHNPKLSSSTSR